MANVWMSFNAGSRPTDRDGLTGKRIWSTQNSIYERFMIGTNGMLRLRDEHELLFNHDLVQRSDNDASNFARQLEEFADSVRERRTPLASGQEVLGVMKVIDGCFASIRNNQVITL